MLCSKLIKVVKFELIGYRKLYAKKCSAVNFVALFIRN